MSNPASNGNRKETATQRYIRLLSVLAEATAPMFTTRDEPREDVLAFEELLEGGFITGYRAADSMNVVQAVMDMRITVPGRTLLEELQEKESLKTSWGMIKKYRFAAYALIFSTLAGIAGGWFLKGCDISN